MIVNVPPRHGKSRTAGLLVEWVLGRDPTQKIMTGSYNETLSTMFSKNVRNAIMEQKADLYKPVYADVFPGVYIKRGDGAMNLWSLEGGYNNYLATSPTGTATGFGASLMIIDDLIKNAEEAHNELVKEKHWSWFTDTMLSRLEEGGKLIIIMTRWATDDLAGRALEHYKQSGARLRHVKMKALQDDGTMLCDGILSKKSYLAKIGAMGKEIAAANYQQEPIDIKGRLYTSIQTYTALPTDESGESLLQYLLCYTDTADEGSDYLCSICYGVYDGTYYVLDVLYTSDPMEITEPQTAKMLTEHGIGCAIIESNNGGRGFARNVERECRELGNQHTQITWFHQNKNKVARILSNSTGVMRNVLFPVNWMDRWQDFAKAILAYQRDGKNTHDDAPDALTGVYENPKPQGMWLV
ncbi:phage terminase large subunit [Ruminococcus sp.]|uniref:phage terminase large subunit n=1 Tax=Ruminococcus sp. TaxID=41978 RepID=UPI0039A0E97E